MSCETELKGRQAALGTTMPCEEYVAGGCPRGGAALDRIRELEAEVERAGEQYEARIANLVAEVERLRGERDALRRGMQFITETPLGELMTMGNELSEEEHAAELKLLGIIEGKTS